MATQKILIEIDGIPDDTSAWGDYTDPTSIAGKGSALVQAVAAAVQCTYPDECAASDARVTVTTDFGSFNVPATTPEG